MSFLRRGANGSRHFLLDLGNNSSVIVGDLVDPISANAALRFNTNGTFQRIRSTSDGILTQPSTIFSVSVPNLVANTNFYVRVNHLPAPNSAVPSGSASNTWLQTSAARTWYVTAGPDTETYSALRVEISTSTDYPVDAIFMELSATGGGIA